MEFSGVTSRKKDGFLKVTSRVMLEFSGVTSRKKAKSSQGQLAAKKAGILRGRMKFSEVTSRKKIGIVSGNQQQKGWNSQG